MGVSGAGKSTIGAAIAQRLQVPYIDADDLHPPSNIAKMAAGQPLDDADREPWLDEVGRWMADHPGGAVTACSALKRRYRDQLRRQAPEVRFVHLDGDHAMIAERQADRPGHYMPPSLLTSQFDTLEPLEPDEAGGEVDVGLGVNEVITRALVVAFDEPH